MRQQYSPGAALVVRTTGNPESLLGAVRTQVQQIDKIWRSPTGRPATNSGARAVGRAHGRGLARLFGALALILASLDLWRAGVFGGAANERNRLRMALGAQPVRWWGWCSNRACSCGVGAIGGILVALPVDAWPRPALWCERDRSITYAGITVLLLGVAAAGLLSSCTPRHTHRSCWWHCV